MNEISEAPKKKSLYLRCLTPLDSSFKSPSKTRSPHVATSHSFFDFDILPSYPHSCGDKVRPHSASVPWRLGPLTTWRCPLTINVAIRYAHVASRRGH